MLVAGHSSDCHTVGGTAMQMRWRRGSDALRPLFGTYLRPTRRRSSACASASTTRPPRPARAPPARPPSRSGALGADRRPRPAEQQPRCDLEPREREAREAAGERRAILVQARDEMEVEVAARRRGSRNVVIETCLSNGTDHRVHGNSEAWIQDQRRFCERRTRRIAAPREWRSSQRSSGPPLASAPSA
jgi:hypothetical protein